MIFVWYLFDICLIFVWYLFNVYSIFVWYLFNIYSIFVWNFFNIYPGCPHTFRGQVERKSKHIIPPLCTASSECSPEIKSSPGSFYFFLGFVVIKVGQESFNILGFLTTLRMFRIFEFSFANYQRTLLCSGLKAANQYDQKSWPLWHPVVDLVVVPKPVKH